MGSIKVSAFGRMKPHPKDLFTSEYRLKHDVDGDIISFGTTKNSTEGKSFRFEKIFEQNATQKEIFETVAEPIIDNVLLGYNGTIFTYGHTGTGKTYTMTGEVEDWMNPGLIPRSIQKIFRRKKEDDVVSISYCEIYNEHVYDLIRTDQPDSEVAQVSLLEDSSGLTHFRNLSVHEVATVNEALELLVRGDVNKMVGETASNAKSSRSHVIFSLYLELLSSTDDKLCIKPVLYLVDLAGSEKLSKCSSLNNPWETRYINLSLHYLEQVLIALRQPGRVHIPYRNSLMTALLRNSLGGNCITSMIATFSMAANDLEETLHTCRFAERISMIKNEVKLMTIHSPESQIETLKKENEKLRGQIKLLCGAQPTDELRYKDKKKCVELVRSFIDNNNYLELPLTNIRQLEYCFQLMRDEVIKKDHRYRDLDNTKSERKIALSAQDPPEQDNFENTSKLVSVKPVLDIQENRRKKKSPADLPKINITYKRSRSVEHLSDNGNFACKKVNNKEVLSQESHSTKVSDDKLALPEKNVESFSSKEFSKTDVNNSTESNCQLSSEFKRAKENMKLPKAKVKRAKQFEILVTTNSSSSSEESCTYLDASLTSRAQRSEEWFSIKMLRQLRSIGVQIDADAEFEIEKVVTEIITLDNATTISEESDFSSSFLPLTGDEEVDEEILKFYRARHRILKSNGDNGTQTLSQQEARIRLKEEFEVGSVPAFT